MTAEVIKDGNLRFAWELPIKLYKLKCHFEVTFQGSLYGLFFTY